MRNPVDYRITRNRLFTTGVISSLGALPVPPGSMDAYANIRLRDGRSINYVYFPLLTPIEIERGMKVKVFNYDGKWVGELL